MTTLRRHATKIQTVLLIVTVFTLGFMIGNLQNVTQAQNNTMGDTDQAYQSIQEAISIIKSSYVDADKVDVPSLITAALKGMTDSLGDKHTNYWTADEYSNFNTSMEGNVEGIGVVIDTNADTNEIFVVSLIKGAAAASAGVLPGDIFWEVNGENVVGKNQDELASLVRGPAGTDVTITFKRGEEFLTLTITRVRFEVPNVETNILEGDIAYISLGQFNANSAQQMQDALTQVDPNSHKALILDIRGNPGGFLTSVVDIGSYFVKDGAILYEAFGDGHEDTFNANGNYANITVPIVLLVNEGSASASELLAGALKDYKLATIIGTTTYGKGTVQTIQPMSNGGAMHITIARWLTPNRNWIDGLGITPDIVVPYDPVKDGIDVDPQLNAAIDYINALK